MKISEIVVSKLTSARFLATIMLTFTACIMAYIGKFPMEAFAGLVVLCLRDYFSRSDRPKEENGTKPPATG